MTRPLSSSKKATQCTTDSQTIKSFHAHPRMFASSPCKGTLSGVSEFPNLAGPGTTMHLDALPLQAVVSPPDSQANWQSASR